MRAIFPVCSARRFSRIALAAACLAGARAPARAGDVVSLNLCTDQYLTLLAPERIRALSPLARDPSLSVVAEAANHFPWVRPDAEAVLALRPGLVLAGRFGAQAAIFALQRRKITVLQADDPTDIPGIEAEIRRLAAALGVAPRGENMIAAMRARIPPAAPAPRGTVLLYEARGFTAGPGSLWSRLASLAGWRNIGTGGAMDIEAVLRRPPDVLVVEASPRYPSLATELPHHPALRHLATRIVQPDLLACAGPWSLDAVQVLAP